MDKTELLKKIQMLANRGYNGERDTAAQKLDELMNKYNISADDLSDEKMILEEYQYHGREEYQLLIQIASMVVNVRNGIFYEVQDTRTNRISSKKLAIEATRVQHIEIEFLFDFYKKRWEKEKDLFLRAFVSKNGLFPTLPPDKSTDGGLTREEIIKIVAMAQGIDDERPVRRIEAAESEVEA